MEENENREIPEGEETSVDLPHSQEATTPQPLGETLSEAAAAATEAITQVKQLELQALSETILTVKSLGEELRNLISLTKDTLQQAEALKAEALDLVESLQTMEAAEQILTEQSGSTGDSTAQNADGESHQLATTTNTATSSPLYRLLSSLKQAL